MGQVLRSWLARDAFCILRSAYSLLRCPARGSCPCLLANFGGVSAQSFAQSIAFPVTLAITNSSYRLASMGRGHTLSRFAFGSRARNRARH
jgi:hypothetical protein